MISKIEFFATHDRIVAAAHFDRVCTDGVGNHSAKKDEKQKRDADVNVPCQPDEYWTGASIVIIRLLQLSDDVLADCLIVVDVTHSRPIARGSGYLQTWFSRRRRTDDSQRNR